MPIWTCATCAVEHADTPEPPALCEICTDERQWVPESGQAWVTREGLEAEGYRVVLRGIEPDLFAVETDHPLGIGQRGLLVRTPGGNLLWEPPGYLDSNGVRAVAELGGVAAVTASHPHLTGSSIQWSEAFGGAPVYVAEEDARWIRRPSPAIRLWSGSEAVLPGLRLVQLGGHFPGSCVAVWPAGAGGRGVLLTGDTLMVGADRASVSVMRSFPNLIPLPERIVRRILAALEPLEYDRVYSAFRSIDADAPAVVARSLARYISWVRGDEPE